MVVVFVAVIMVVSVVMALVVVIMVAVADGEFVGAGGEGVGARPLERILGLHELRIEFGGAGEVEAADVEDVVERQGAILGAVDFRDSVDAVDARLKRVEFRRGDQIGLVEQDDVGERDLLHGFVAGVEVLKHVLRVDDGDDGVEAEGCLHLVVGEEGLGDGRGIREAGGLDEDAVELVLALKQPAEDADEVAADGAADAPVVHLEQLLVARNDELVVHADLAELVFNYGQFLAVVFGEDAVEEGGLAGAEKTGEDGDGNGHESATSEM